MDDQTLINHYVNYGYHEGRAYKNTLPSDFDPSTYRKLYCDIVEYNNDEATRHYITHGVKEGRIYQYNPEFGKIHCHFSVKLRDIIAASQIYVINLANRRDRKDSVLRQLKKLNLDHEFLVATDGNDLIREFVNLTKEGKRFNSPGHLGCLYSHLEVVRLAKQRGQKSIIIFEDDIYFHKKFWDIVDSVELPSDWDIIYLGAKDLTRIFLNNNLPFYRAFLTFGRFAYIIHERMYDFLIALWKKKEKHGDRYLVEEVQPMFICYVLRDNVVIANLADSDSQPGQDLNQWSTLHNWSLDNYYVSQKEYKTLMKEFNMICRKWMKSRKIGS